MQILRNKMTDGYLESEFIQRWLSVRDAPERRQFPTFSAHHNGPFESTICNVNYRCFSPEYKIVAAQPADQINCRYTNDDPVWNHSGSQIVSQIAMNE